MIPVVEMYEYVEYCSFQYMDVPQDWWLPTGKSYLLSAEH